MNILLATAEGEKSVNGCSTHADFLQFLVFRLYLCRDSEGLSIWVLKNIYFTVKSIKI